MKEGEGRTGVREEKSGGRGTAVDKADKFMERAGYSERGQGEDRRERARGNDLNDAWSPTNALHRASGPPGDRSTCTYCLGSKQKNGTREPADSAAATIPG